VSTRYNDGSHYENHPQAAELRDGPAHAHSVAEQHGQQDHLSPHEQTRQAEEYSHHSHHDAEGVPTVGHGIAAFGHAEIAAMAHQLWIERGSPDGSPDDDWFRAAEILRSRAHTD
jgi:hypothetical protein